MIRKAKFLYIAALLIILLLLLLPASDNAALLTGSEYFPKAHSLISNASKSVYVVMYSFRYYDEYEDSPSDILARDLIKAKQRGADVKVLLDVSDRDEESTKENRKTGKILAENGVEVYYDAPDKTTHSKMVVIDSKYCLVGSHNWTYSGLSKNNETSILIDSRELAKNAEKYIMELINDKN